MAGVQAPPGTLSQLETDVVTLADRINQLGAQRANLKTAQDQQQKQSTAAATAQAAIGKLEQEVAARDQAHKDGRVYGQPATTTTAAAT